MRDLSINLLTYTGLALIVAGWLAKKDRPWKRRALETAAIAGSCHYLVNLLARESFAHFSWPLTFVAIGAAFAIGQGFLLLRLRSPVASARDWALPFAASLLLLMAQNEIRNLLSRWGP